jgi:hypothetical protein
VCIYIIIHSLNSCLKYVLICYSSESDESDHGPSCKKQLTIIVRRGIEKTDIHTYVHTYIFSVLLKNP